MKRFLIKLLLIITIVFVADRCLSFAVSYFFEKTTTTDEYKINSVIRNMKDPIVFMGSSRCHHHYVPSVIADSLKTNVYNAGLWGMRNIYFQYGLLCNILERYTPQTIFLELHPIDYLKTPYSNIEKAGSLIPFINYSNGSDEILKKADIYYKAQISHLYRYNSQFANILAGNLSNRSNVEAKGYKPLKGILTVNQGNVDPEKFEFEADPNKIYYLQKFIDRCREKKIKLVFLFSPMYAIERNHMFDIPNQIAAKNKIPFINNYSMKGITGHNEYYFDFGHLNDAGARKYSSMIAGELKRQINEK